MLTDPNPPAPTAPPAPPRPGTPTASSPTASPGPAPAIPPITLDAGTFRRFVTAAWSRPRTTGRPVADHRAMKGPAPDVLVAHRLKSFS